MEKVKKRKITRESFMQEKKDLVIKELEETGSVSSETCLEYSLYKNCDLHRDFDDEEQKVFNSLLEKRRNDVVNELRENKDVSVETCARYLLLKRRGLYGSFGEK